MEWMQEQHLPESMLQIHCVLSKVVARVKSVMTHGSGFGSCLKIAEGWVNRRKAGLGAVPPLSWWFRVVCTSMSGSQISAGHLLQESFGAAMGSDQSGQVWDVKPGGLKEAASATCTQPCLRALLPMIQKGMWLTDAYYSQDGTNPRNQNSM